MGFVNINSNIGNQVDGTMNVIGSDPEQQLKFIQLQLDAILGKLQKMEGRENTNSDVGKALNAVAEIKNEVLSSSPRIEHMERALGVIAGVASVVSLADQIKPFLRNLF